MDAGVQPSVQSNPHVLQSTGVSPRRRAEINDDVLKTP
jgi:hypothetical protein